MACRLVGAIVWTNAGILLIRTRGTNIKQNLYIFVQENALANVFREWWQFYLGLNVSSNTEWCVRWNHHKTQHNANHVCYILWCSVIHPSRSNSSCKCLSNMHATCYPGRVMMPWIICLLIIHYNISISRSDITHYIIPKYIRNTWITVKRGGFPLFTTCWSIIQCH